MRQFGTTRPIVKACLFSTGQGRRLIVVSSTTECLRLLTDQARRWSHRSLCYGAETGYTPDSIAFFTPNIPSKSCKMGGCQFFVGPNCWMCRLEASDGIGGVSWRCQGLPHRTVGMCVGRHASWDRRPAILAEAIKMFRRFRNRRRCADEDRMFRYYRLNG